MPMDTFHCVHDMSTKMSALARFTNFVTLSQLSAKIYSYQ